MILVHWAYKNYPLKLSTEYSISNILFHNNLLHGATGSSFVKGQTIKNPS
jgi:hypothetical protein